jgi:two-component system, NarL family, sensor histidine kinase UhpB
MSGVLRLGGRSMLQRVVFVNVLIVLGGAIAGTLITRQLQGREPVALIAGFFVLGAVAIATADGLVVRAAFRPLLRVTEALAAVHKGVPAPVETAAAVAAAVQNADPDLRVVAGALTELLGRLESESHAYSARIFESIEDERRRIGRELHDDTSQSLAAALMNIDVAQKGLRECRPEMRLRAEAARAAVAESIEAIKLLVFDLRPTTLDDFGLVPALRRYVQAHMQLPDLTVITDFEGAGRRLPANVEIAVCRIAQESLANVVQHAGATRVTLRLQTEPEYVALAIEDNGRGFDPAGTVIDTRAPHGVGLLSIRERAELLGGSVNIDTAPGRGTRVYVVIPVRGGQES